MNGLKTSLAAGLLALILVPVSVSAMGLELAVGGWIQSPSGDFSYTQNGVQDNLSLKNDLKYTDATKLIGRVKLETPLFLPNLYLMATPMDFSGTGRKNMNFQFGDYIFNGNTDFTSKLQLNHYDLALYYGIPFLKTATADILNIDLGINARLIDLKAAVTGETTVSGVTQTETKSKDLQVPVPMVYLGIQLYPVKWLGAEAEARAITYSKNHYFDVIARAKVKPFGPVFLAAGYRYERVEIDVDDIKAKITFSGPFAEAGLQF